MKRLCKKIFSLSFPVIFSLLELYVLMNSYEDTDFFVAVFIVLIVFGIVPIFLILKFDVDISYLFVFRLICAPIVDDICMLTLIFDTIIIYFSIVVFYCAFIESAYINKKTLDNGLTHIDKAVILLSNPIIHLFILFFVPIIFGYQIITFRKII